MKMVLALLGVMQLLLFLNCATGVTGGIGHEGEARVLGKVVGSDGGDIPDGASVYINCIDSVADIASSDERRKPDAFVDDKGEFVLDSIAPGRYLIEVSEDDENAVCIPVKVLRSDREITLDEETLQHTGTIRGKLVLLSDSAASIYVQIYGLDRVAKVDARTDSFTIDGMPEGNYTLRIVSETGNLSPKDINSVAVEPDRITSVGFVYQSTSEDEGFTKKVLLNTTADGAAISEDVYAFPVLVRLDEEHFDFSTAASDGSDIRFTGADGEYLSFEMEYFNASEEAGVFWVRVDTVYGDNSKQYFLMKWGTSPEGPSSNGYAVFDTAKGFQGVWHLGEPGMDTIRDATINCFHGIGYGFETGETFKGEIGNAQLFDGASSYIAMPGTAESRLNFAENSRFSVSAWVRIDALENNFLSVVSKSNQLYSLGVDDANNWEFFEFEDENAWVANLSPAEAGVWKHLYAVVENEKQYLYVDGVCVDSTAEPIGETRYRVTTDPVTIGKRTTSTIDGWFNGLIDEVRIESAARSDSWIRLCYANQRNDNSFITLTE